MIVYIIQFNEWERYFFALIKLNFNAIKDSKADWHLIVLRNTRISELKKIEKDFEN